MTSPFTSFHSPSFYSYSSPSILSLDFFHFHISSSLSPKKFLPLFWLFISDQISLSSYFDSSLSLSLSLYLSSTQPLLFLIPLSSPSFLLSQFFYFSCLTSLSLFSKSTFFAHSFLSHSLSLSLSLHLSILSLFSTYIFYFSNLFTSSSYIFTFPFTTPFVSFHNS